MNLIVPKQSSLSDIEYLLMRLRYMLLIREPFLVHFFPKHWKFIVWALQKPYTIALLCLSALRLVSREAERKLVRSVSWILP